MAIVLEVLLVVVPILIVIALVLGGAYLVYQGLDYWVDISGPSHDQSQGLSFQPVGELSVFYPDMIRPSSAYTIDLELQPSAPMTRTHVLTLTVAEDSDFVSLSSTTITMPITSAVLRSRSVQLRTRNPSLPPKTVDIAIQGYLDESAEPEDVTLPIRVDELTVRIRAIVSIIVGAIGVIAVLVGLVIASG